MKWAGLLHKTHRCERYLKQRVRTGPFNAVSCCISDKVKNNSYLMERSSVLLKTLLYCLSSSSELFGDSNDDDK